jgi:hypothetical protein
MSLRNDFHSQASSTLELATWQQQRQPMDDLCEVVCPEMHQKQQAPKAELRTTKTS